MEEVHITHLRCLNGCGGPLVITDEDLAECDYCGNRYRITGYVEEIVGMGESDGEGPYTPYFCYPDRYCQRCSWWNEFKWRVPYCDYWNKRADWDMTCDHFDGSCANDYFYKGGEGVRDYPYFDDGEERYVGKIEPYPYGVVYPAHEKCSRNCKFYRNIFGVERCKHPNVIFVATGVRCAKFERRK